jgi:hypothetical protein
MKGFLEHIKDDLDSYFLIIESFDSVLSKTHQKVEMGILGEIPIYFWYSPKSEYLVSSGWQGKEEAGIFASHKLANSIAKEKFSFLPIACPPCVLSRSSKNFHWNNIDRKFDSSRESEVDAIRSNETLILQSSTKGHFALHEDPKRSFPYYYVWGEMNLDLVENSFRKHFGDSPWKLKWSPNGKGMFCEYVYNQGIPFSIQLETPADGSYSLEKRSSCLSEIVENYVRWNTEQPH